MKAYSPELEVAVEAEMLKVIALFQHFADTLPKKFRSMYLEDVRYNTKALVKFKKDHDVVKLEDNIMYQDTSPREHMIKVLQLVESPAVL